MKLELRPRVGCYTLATPVCGRLRPACHTFETRPNFIRRWCLKGQRVRGVVRWQPSCLACVRPWVWSTAEREKCVAGGRGRCSVGYTPRLTSWTRMASFILKHVHWTATSGYLQPFYTNSSPLCA